MEEVLHQLIIWQISHDFHDETQMSGGCLGFLPSTVAHNNKAVQLFFGSEF